MPLTAYQSAFELLAARLKPESVPTRRAFLDQFLVKGFPGRKLEDWRYTDLTPLNDKAFALAPAGALDLQSLKLPKTDRVVFINGQLDREQSTADELAGLVADEPVADDAVAALNAAFALPGLDFKLGRNASIARVLHVIIASEPGSPASMSHQRHRIELGELASAHVVLEFRGGGEHFQTHTIDVHLGPGARLKLDRIQRDAAASTLLTRIDAHLERDARLDAVCIDGGAGLARHDFNVELAAAGAEVHLSGLYLPAAGAHIDNHTRIIHAAPHGISREHFKGIVDARAHAVFNGKIVVQPGAQKTDSEQRVANLLLSSRAEINAKPELEIYADDVKCAHGATVGQLDAKALAYLRSRGVDSETARTLLLHAFAGEIIDTLEIPALRERLSAELGLAADSLADLAGSMEEAP